MNRILLIVGGLLVGLLAALFIVPVFVDWNRYRGSFEEEATRLLGRDVRVSGKVNLRLLPTPYIRFEKVRIADTQSGTGEPLFKAEDFTVWLAVGPLFSGALEANEIELKKPVLTLVLDEQGSGNWSDLGAVKSSATFLPSSVALNAVRITDGTITVLAPGAIERARVVHINGEVSAASLQGPFKVAAAFSTHGAMREIRASTAAPEADGSIRFKGTVRGIESGGSYTLDGRARDILGQLKVDGEFTAKVPLPRPVVDAAAPAVPAGTETGVVDIKSAFKADTEAIEFSDIALAFEQSGRPQLASGTARMAWRLRNDLDLTLTSKWLDLDRISGEDATGRPLAVLARLARNLGSQLPNDGRNSIRLELDQATLGGEVVSAVSATLERSGPVLNLKSLQAALPGNSRIEASGILTPEAGAALFEGATVLRGASLSRMMAWAARGVDGNTLGHDGSFVISGRMRLGEEVFEGRDLTLRLGRHSLTGEASWSGGANRKLRLVLDGTELDVSPFTDRQTRPLAAVRTAVDRLVSGQPEAAKSATASPPLPIDVQARVRFGRLIVGSTVLSDVAADLTYAGGNLTLPLLRIGQADEWQVELRGDIAGLMRPGARGSVSGHVFAQTPEHLETLLGLLEVPERFRPVARRAGHIVPLRLAGRMAVGDKGAEAYDLQLDGRAGLTRVAGTLLFTRSGDGWVDGATDVAVTFEGGEARHLLAQLLPEALQPQVAAAPLAEQRPVRAVLRAIGKPKDGMSAIATFDGADLAAEFRGRLTANDSAEMTLGGDLRLATSDLGAAVAATGYRPRPALAGIPVAGNIALSNAGQRWSLATADLSLAANRLLGRIDIDTTGAAAKITGQLSAGRASLPYALALVSTADTSEVRRSNERATAAAASRQDWSHGIFDFTPLAGLDLAVTLETPVLEIAPAVTVTDAKLEIAAREGNLTFKLPSATALAGAFSGNLSIKRALAGTHLTGTASLTAGRLDAVMPTAANRAAGRLDLKIDVNALGQGPHSLISALKGTGELRLSEAQLPGLAPFAPRQVAEAITVLKGELPAGEVKRQLEAALAAGTLPVGRRTLAIDVVDGVARLAPIVVESADGRATGSTVADLAALKFDSEWRLDPAPPASDRKGQRPPVPGVIVVYTGSLARLDTIARRLQVDAFERELVVRKYERDVEELERVRREDEERVRQETERRRLEELERRPRLVEPDPVAPAPAPAPDPQKQTFIEPAAPRLPPLGPLLQRPETPAGPGPAEPISPSTAPPQSGSIPASAQTVPPPAAPVPVRRAPGAGTAAAPPRDILRDINRNSP